MCAFLSHLCVTTTRRFGCYFSLLCNRKDRPECHRRKSDAKLQIEIIRGRLDKKYAQLFVVVWFIIWQRAKLVGEQCSGALVKKKPIMFAKSFSRLLFTNWTKQFNIRLHRNTYDRYRPPSRVCMLAAHGARTPNESRILHRRRCRVREN